MDTTVGPDGRRAPADRGERGSRVVAATLDNIKRIGRGMLPVDPRYWLAWVSKLYGKLHGGPVVAPPNA